jgi:glycosyltransferase involved in cell wall biosynthesis
MSNELPRTLFVGHGSGGVCWYRCALPAMALGQDWIGATGSPPRLDYLSGLAKRSITLDDFASYEVVVLQIPVGREWLGVIRDLQERGVSVLFEIDDYMQGVRKIDSHELKDVVTREWVKSAELNMRAADGVICSTPYLAQRYRAFNANVHVAPNGIDLKRYAYARPVHDHVTIGWAGTIGHKASIGRWLPAVGAVLRARPQARFTSVGSPFADSLVDEFGAQRCRSLPFAPLEVYPASMSTFDVALAPSGNNNLFKGKSDLRLLEAGALGIPVVGDPSVYAELEDGVTGLHAATAEEAAAAMITLIDDAQRRRAMGAAIREYVAERRAFPRAAGPWADILRATAARRAAGTLAA